MVLLKLVDRMLACFEALQGCAIRLSAWLIMITLNTQFSVLHLHQMRCSYACMILLLVSLRKAIGLLVVSCCHFAFQVASSVLHLWQGVPSILALWRILLTQGSGQRVQSPTPNLYGTDPPTIQWVITPMDINCLPHTMKF